MKERRIYLVELLLIVVFTHGIVFLSSGCGKSQKEVKTGGLSEQEERLINEGMTKYSGQRKDLPSKSGLKSDKDLTDFLWKAKTERASYLPDDAGEIYENLPLGNVNPAVNPAVSIERETRRIKVNGEYREMIVEYQKIPPVRSSARTEIPVMRKDRVNNSRSTPR
ncbi:MAG: hypothetical protein HQM10_20890 [Candidatus Riflebacteria bacterium]|nr:hypothetical protein [Candidatus Riflebacteria bacterium]